MKRILTLLLIMVLAFQMSSVCVMADSPVKVYVNGTAVEFDQQPVIENDRTLVPMRRVFEALGAEVSYNDGVITGEKGGIKVVISAGSSEAEIDGEKVLLDIPARIENDRVLVPLRFIGEAFGDDVQWEAKNRRVFISSNNRAKKAPELDEIPTADAVLAALPEGEVIYTREDLMNEDCFVFYNERDPEDCTYKKVKVEDMPFDEAYQIDVTEEPDINYAYGFTAIGKADIKQGDIVLVSITMRNINSAADENSCSVELVYEQRESPWDKFLRTTVSAGQKWSTFYAYFTAKTDLNAQDMKMVIRLGGKPQLFEIGDFTMVNYKKSVTVDDMPATAYEAYEGIEDDAPWRAEADARIEKYRKGDMTVKVTDENGMPVPDAKVKVNMTNHEFEFGSVLWSSPEYMNNDNYFKALKENFNTLVIGNELKWPYFEKNTTKSLAIAKWAADNGFKLRGHALVWDHTKHMPDDLRDIYSSGDFDAISTRFEEHIKETTAALKDYVYEWDVLNEPIMNNQFRTAYGSEFAAKWFDWTEETVPDTIRVLNDTGIVGYSTPKTDQLHKIIDDLLANGADIQGLGIQGHFGVSCNPENFYNQLDELSQSYNLPIKVTEFSHHADPIIQGYFTRDIMTEVFSLEKANGFIMWGCDEGTGGSSTPMYYKDWSLKPAGEQIRYLMFDKWWTDVIGVTDADGEFTARAFYGDYEITTEVNGSKQVDIVRFLKDGDKNITVTLGKPVIDSSARNLVPKREKAEIPSDAWEEVRSVAFDESDTVRVKNADGVDCLIVKNIFDGLDTSTHTAYRIELETENDSGAVAKLAEITGKNGEIKISGVSEALPYYYFNDKKANALCIEIAGSDAEIVLETIKIYKLRDGYFPS